MSYALLRAELGRKVYGDWWTGGPVFEPGATVVRPAPTVARDASYLAWEYDVPSAELLTMGGSKKIDGELRLGYWFESAAFDVHDAGVLDAIVSAFECKTSALGGGSAVTFMVPVPGQFYESGDFRGREVVIPFIYLKESA